MQINVCSVALQEVLATYEVQFKTHHEELDFFRILNRITKNSQLSVHPVIEEQKTDVIVIAPYECIHRITCKSFYVQRVITHSKHVEKEKPIYVSNAIETGYNIPNVDWSYITFNDSDELLNAAIDIRNQGYHVGLCGKNALTLSIYRHDGEGGLNYFYVKDNTTIMCVYSEREQVRSTVGYTISLDNFNKQVIK